MTKLLIKLFIKDNSDVSSPAVRDSYGTLGSFTGIACNLFLFIIKLLLGIISGAVSVIADAFNNLADIGSSVITLLGFKLSKKPADPDHPFGHGRIEYMSAFVVAMLIMLVGFELLKSSVDKIIHPEKITVSLITIIGLVVSIGIKFWMNLFNRKLGNIINSASLKATAQDSLNDCIATSCVLISVLVFKIIGINIDPYVGVLVAGFIIWSGFCAAKETLDPLLGEAPTPEMVENISNVIMENEQFFGIHDLIVHNYGPGRCFASVHVEVPQDIDILYCHELIDACEAELRKRLNIEVVIHMDPIATNDERVTELRCELAERIKELDRRFSIHDFRMVEGENRTNLIFDLVVPADYKFEPSEFKAKISEKAKSIDPKFFCVINIDRDFTGR